MTKDETPRVVEAAQWTKAELEDWCRSWCRTPHTALKAFIDAGFCSDQAPSREEMRLLRQPDTSTVDATKAVMSRPAEPARDAEPIWYRGWECAFDSEAASWSCEGWVGYLGGADLDCATASGRTWSDLLDEIDEHDMTEARV